MGQRLLKDGEATAGGLADGLRRRTRRLHRRAERSGILADILTGRASRKGYALLLRNLHPVYEALESALEAARGEPRIGRLADPAVYRAAALEADLLRLWGPRWRQELPLLPAGEDYARRIEESAGRSCTALLGHSYTRYLGDLNGGQVLRALLRRSLALEDDCLTFYDFPAVEDLEGFRATYREGFNEAALTAEEAAAAVDEGARAFAHNIVLARAVRAAAAAPLRQA